MRIIKDIAHLISRYIVPSRKVYELKNSIKKLLDVDDEPTLLDCPEIFSNPRTLHIIKKKSVGSAQWTNLMKNPNKEIIPIIIKHWATYLKIPETLGILLNPNPYIVRAIWNKYKNDIIQLINGNPTNTKWYACAHDETTAMALASIKSNKEPLRELGSNPNQLAVGYILENLPRAQLEYLALNTHDDILDKLDLLLEVSRDITQIAKLLETNKYETYESDEDSDDETYLDTKLFKTFSKNLSSNPSKKAIQLVWYTSSAKYLDYKSFMKNPNPVAIEYIKRLDFIMCLPDMDFRVIDYRQAQCLLANPNNEIFNMYIRYVSKHDRQIQWYKCAGNPWLFRLVSSKFYKSDRRKAIIIIARNLE